MRVDFYQLSQTPVEGALPQLAAKMLEAGARVLVVSADSAQRARISDALWAARQHFLRPFIQVFYESEDPGSAVSETLEIHCVRRVWTDRRQDG